MREGQVDAFCEAGDLASPRHFPQNFCWFRDKNKTLDTRHSSEPARYSEPTLSNHCLNSFFSYANISIHFTNASSPHLRGQSYPLPQIDALRVPLDVTSKQIIEFEAVLCDPAFLRPYLAVDDETREYYCYPTVALMQTPTYCTKNASR
jgi:hypothetical protein